MIEDKGTTHRGNVFVPFPLSSVEYLCTYIGAGNEPSALLCLPQRKQKSFLLGKRSILGIAEVLKK